MNRLTAYTRLLTLLIASATLGACSTWQKVAGKPADYKQSRTEAPLEIPPDLSSATIEDALAVPGGTASYSDFERGERTRVAPEASGVLVQPQGMHIERHGDKQWLVVESSADAVWPKVRDFWLQGGFLLTLDDPAVGILETDWAENRADIPQDFIRRTLGRVLNPLYSSATRDRFRMRLERAGAASTEVFISHRGMQEVAQGGAESSQGTLWKPRPSDPELEAEMLKRLMVSLGSEAQQADAQLAQPAVQQAARAQLRVGGADQVSLVVEEGFSRAWREVGLALDRVGFTVEDRDRSNGVYFVRYNDPLKEDKQRGFLAKLKFWGDDDLKATDQYRVQLTAAGDKTEVTVHDAQGQRDNSPTAKRILTLVQEQMR
ncbi:MAG: outer membrane protein assembly factor BamC [Gammaproteobacteria bacterium]